MAVKFSDLVKQYGSTSAALAATGNTKGADGVWRSNGTSSSGGSTSTSGSSSSSGSGSSSKSSSGSKSNADSYAGTNYHQQAIDAAARNDWAGVQTALNNRQDKTNATGNDYGISNEQILADLQRQYGISSSGGGGPSSSSSTSGNRVTSLPGNAQPSQATPTPLAPAQPPALNQYGFRDNFDYTLALQDTNLTPEQRAQYIQERQNKIYTNYGGVEPNMAGSDQKFSQTDAGRGSGVTNTYQGIEYTKEPNTGMYGVPVLDSAVKNYKQGGVTYQTGPLMGRITDPNIIKNGYYISNGYTVFVDQNGTATRAVKGVADYTPHLDSNAGNGTYNQSGAWTDNQMLSVNELEQIANYRKAAAAGEIPWAEANQKANAIRSGYGYSIDGNGYVTDYGALTAVNDRRQQMGLDTNAENGYAAYYRYLMNTDTSPAAQAAGQVKTYQQFAQENGYDVSAPTGVNGVVPTVQTVPLPGNSVIGSSGAAGGGVGGGYGADISDVSQYLRDMYAQQAAAQLAALKSTYEQNVLDYQAQDNLISEEAQRQRNQAAAQNDLQRMYMNELGIMQGLNTGTTGQMALAQSAMLQGSLANIGTQEAQALADNSLALAKLKAQYSAAMDQAAADGNYQLALALYNEYVRQQNLAMQQQASAQDQANWKAQFNYQQAKDALAQQNWKAQFDYQKQQDDLDYKLAMMKLNAQNGTGGTTRTGGRTTTYDNGSMTTEQVKQLQKKLGVNPDGKWGTQSSAAAGDLTADEAWAKYGGYDMSFEELKSTITRYLSLGGLKRAQNILDSHWDSLTTAQQKELSELFG